MNILLTGGSGFIGQHLRDRLQDHQLWMLTRRALSPAEAGAARCVHAASEIDAPLDAVINLAGENIAAARWSDKRKRQLRDSRIALTGQLAADLAASGQSPATWINASAVGYYGPTAGGSVAESAPPGRDFAALLCRDWEAAATQAAAHFGARLVILRLGVVIGPGGGALARMLLPFRLGLGAVVGPGHQHMPWIALDDVLAIIGQAMTDASWHGAYNLVSPEAVTQQMFAASLARVLRRPLLFKAPAGLLRLGLGEMASLLIEDQNIRPARLQSEGYEFQAARLEDALRAALG